MQASSREETPSVFLTLSSQSTAPSRAALGGTWQVVNGNNNDDRQLCLQLSPYFLPVPGTGSHEVPFFYHRLKSNLSGAERRTFTMGEQEKWRIQNGKVPPRTAPNQIPRAKRTASGLSLANGSGCAERETERVGRAPGPWPHTGQGVCVARGHETVPSCHRTVHGGIPREQMSSGEEGARMTKSQALRLYLSQTKPQTCTRSAPRFLSWLRHL